MQDVFFKRKNFKEHKIPNCRICYMDLEKNQLLEFYGKEIQIVCLCLNLEYKLIFL